MGTSTGTGTLDGVLKRAAEAAEVKAEAEASTKAAAKAGREATAADREARISYAERTLGVTLDRETCVSFRTERRLGRTLELDVFASLRSAEFAHPRDGVRFELDGVQLAAYDGFLTVGERFDVPLKRGVCIEVYPVIFRELDEFPEALAGYRAMEAAAVDKAPKRWRRLQGRA